MFAPGCVRVAPPARKGNIHMTTSEFEALKNRIFTLLDFHSTDQLRYVPADGVYSERRDGQGFVGGASVPQTARALFLYAQTVSGGKTAFRIEQTPAFSLLGAMLDVSRGKVLRVEKVKEYIDYLACMGMNALMLYTEDVYEMEGYPLFGYMRGRYTLDELRQIDDYACSMGIECIPCIQTLGHMEQYLKWAQTASLQDTDSVMLVDDPRTYALVESMVKTMRGAFRSKRIHIGMDESNYFAFGRYTRLFANGVGYTHKQRHSIFTRHVNRVWEICHSYDFHPMMWSDMFYILTSDLGCHVPDCGEFDPEMLKNIPDVDMVCWNYEADGEHLHKLLRKNSRLGKTSAFAGGCHIWEAPLPLPVRAAGCNEAALKACLENPDVKEVWATVWSDPTSCELAGAIPMMTAYSEYCYRGSACTQADITAAAEYLTKIPNALYETMERISPVCDGFRLDSRALLQGNLLYAFGISEKNLEGFIRNAEAALPVFEKAAADPTDRNHGFYDYARLLFETVLRKAELMLKLRKAYRGGDKAYLKTAADTLLPDLSAAYEALERRSYTNHMENCKSFGYEVLAAKYGQQVALNRLTAGKLNDYLENRLPVIEELEEPLCEAIPGKGFNHTTACKIGVV